MISKLGRLPFFTTLLFLLGVVGCDSSARKVDESTGPKTFFGESVQKARESDSMLSEKDDEFKAQADQLTEE